VATFTAAFFFRAVPGARVGHGYFRLEHGAVLVHNNKNSHTVKLVARFGLSQRQSALNSTASASNTTAAAQDDPGYAGLDAHPICSFLASGRAAP
jgi:hypothetical protein